MLSEEKVEVLEAYDLTNCYRSAAELTGVDHHTVATLVAARAARAAGTLGTAPTPRASVADTFADKIDQWVERSSGKIRADVIHDRLVAMGYSGSERTTRRVVAHAKAAWRRKTHRIYKPWITEPGHWLQWDYGDGPLVDGMSTVLFCAWLAWSRSLFKHRTVGSGWRNSQELWMRNRVQAATDPVLSLSVVSSG